MKYAIPVGTGVMLEFSKFMLELRDNSCTACRTGYKSVATKVIQTKSYQVPVMCVCVPYIASEDKDGNLVVVYKGFRELWPSRKRPEQYIQNDIQRKLELERAKQNMANARGQSRAHDGVTPNKYTLGVIPASERQALGAELAKSLQPTFMKEGETPEVKSAKDFVSHQLTRKVPMRNTEGHIIMVDDATALNMKSKGLATPERPAENPELADTPKVSKSVAKRVKAQKTNQEIPIGTDGNLPVMDSSNAPVKRGRGRPKGSKNLPKPVKE
jgi:hypothetical protein